MLSNRSTLSALALASIAAAIDLPGQVSTGCSAFLDTLNADATLQSCLTPILTGLNAFDETSAGSLSTDAVSTALAELCKVPGCETATYSATLQMFAGNCSVELGQAKGPGGANEAVHDAYDLFYIARPLRQAICTIDQSSNKACLLSLGSTEVKSTTNVNATVSQPAVAAANANSTATFNLQNFVADTVKSPERLYAALTENVAKRFARRQETVSISASESSSAAAPSGSPSSGSSINAGEEAVIAVPEKSTWATSNAAFLFLNGKMPSELLCTSCAKQILAIYVKWFNDVPYLSGIDKSGTLNGMTSLWQSVGSTCGASTLDSINVLAGQKGNVVVDAAFSLSAPRLTLVAFAGVVAYMAL